MRVGKTARLDGTVTGIPMPSVAWTKNGQPMSESERYEFVGVTKDGEFSLIIKDVVLDDFAEVTFNLNRDSLNKVFNFLDCPIYERVGCRTTYLCRHVFS